MINFTKLTDEWPPMGVRVLLLMGTQFDYDSPVLYWYTMGKWCCTNSWIIPDMQPATSVIGFCLLPEYKEDK